MYRSASTSRVSDDHYSYYSSSSPPSKVSPAVRSLSLEANELPQYEPISEMAKRERAKMRFAENSVHFIPLVLLLCAFILWFFSNPNIDVPLRGDSIAAKIEGLTLEGEIDSDGTQAIAGLDLGDLDPLKQDEDKNVPLLEHRSS